MAYFSGTDDSFAIYGPDNLFAGVAESKKLAEVWCEVLAERESEILAALDNEDFSNAERIRIAERIWREVEEAARVQVVGE